MCFWFAAGKNQTLGTDCSGGGGDDSDIRIVTGDGTVGIKIALVLEMLFLRAMLFGWIT
jgi:hypothetical protein